MKTIPSVIAMALFSLSWTPVVNAEDDSKPMNNIRLGEIITKLDERAAGQPGFWRFHIKEREVLLITDEQADRMRVIAVIDKAEALDQKHLFRLMQANFDTALDARYAIAKGYLWSAFIHPLSPLTDEQFISGVAQVVTLVVTYGSTYSSGAMSFGGGDSGGLIRELLERSKAI
ncbi:MAG: hypothetical protein GKR94_23525 [Gammaproteobacteria bacterium]|nr:hypothetical protein [Gammaproteobacteria bacterium]